MPAMKLSVGRTATALTAATSSSSTSAISSSHQSNAYYQSKISKLALSIEPRVLAQTRGSGNHGESGTAAFWTIDKLSSALANMSSATTATEDCPVVLQRQDIDLGPNRIAFTIDNVLTHDEANALAACAEAILERNNHSRLAPGISTPPGMRVNEAAHWYPPHDKHQNHFLGAIFNRIQHLVPQTIPNDETNNSKELLPLYPRLSEKVAQFKYNPGDQFRRHTDGLFPGQGANPDGTGIEEWNGVVSGFSVLFYLNDSETDGLQGGETRLWSANGTNYVDVAPKKGRVLVFRRGSAAGAVLHAGLPVTGPMPKYMALVNLVYGERIGTRPMQLMA